MIDVLASGQGVYVQDGGRVGYAALGVPRSGAFDRAAWRTANRIVGNPPWAAALEVTLGRLSIQAEAACTVAVTGAPCPGVAWGTPISLRAGERLQLGTPTAGVRSYLAVRGGIDVPPVLGSRSTDTLGGLGPPPVRTGDRLPVGRQPANQVAGVDAVPADGQAPVRVLPGPRADWLEPHAMALLTTIEWRVRADSDRIGVRLDGPALRRRRHDELPSEPTLPGAIQVPADGRPIVFGPDAPVTGGYPVVAIVADADLDALAQVRPGDTVRFSSAPGAAPATQARPPRRRPGS
ncbi:MAG: hypothetical protein QOD45_1547 [Pseudonocardiales bacterium]|jgi:biotin-dependent carboxylase-like uncharacterized protein|nr:hypothetical protein [Pseudonocardiales bacterium]